MCYQTTIITLGMSLPALKANHLTHAVYAVPLMYRFTMYES